jgi:hypothetical protein
MQIYVNQKHIERRASIGKWASLLGLAVLAAGFLISLRSPELFFISFAALLLGFVLSQVGLYFANRYARPDRPDAVLAQALKGFDDRYALYQFLFPSPNVLREPGGVTIFVLKPQQGQILYQDGKWRNKQGWIRLLRWIGQEGIGKPDEEAAHQVQNLENWLQEQAPDLEVPVRAVVAFTHPQAELQLDNPPLPAMSADNVKNWLRRSGKLHPLPKETFERLSEVLDEAAGVDEQEDT